MYLHGEFVNKRGNVIKVEILTQGSRVPDYEIGSKASGIYFSDDPVSIDSEMNDTFDVLLIHSATIRLESAVELTGLYCSNCMDAVVNIRRDGECIFAGYVQPQAYSQSFNSIDDEVEINCIDALSALQYLPYGGAGREVIYEEALRNAGLKTFFSLITSSLGKVASGLDIASGQDYVLEYDGSRNVPDINNYIFNAVSISELLFLGDDEDSIWTEQEVMEEMFRYLNLHIEQQGFTFRIFSWDTIKSGSPFVWINLRVGTARTVTSKLHDITADLVADVNTNIEIGETFNVISLTCDVKNIEDFIESPLSGDTLTSPYLKRQKYYWSFFPSGGKDSMSYYWFMRVMDNPNWKFNSTKKKDLISSVSLNGNAVQETLPNFLGRLKKEKSIGCSIIAWGHIEEENNIVTDNSPKATVDMSEYMVITIGGNRDDKNPYPSDEDILSAIPVAEYVGKASGITLVPADAETTHYLVFSGKILLSCITPKGEKIKYKNKEGEQGQRWYYTREPNGQPILADWDIEAGLYPPDTNPDGEYEFKYSTVGGSSDTISKVSAIACMLVIGDKCLVETDYKGQPSDFEWRPYKSREECESDDEYYEQCFTLGFDPKLKDMIIGTEFPIQNNINYDMGLETEGTAVPIKRDDNLSGKVTFKILGPVNSEWDDISRRHKTWFRKVKWSTNSIPLLAHVENIYLKDFEMKLVSDNGKVESDEDADIIYMSDTDESYVNKKDDITFRFTSGLTSEERKALGIADTLNLSSPVLTNGGNPLLSIKDQNINETGKPEQLYVDAAWREYHKVKVEMTQTIQDKGDNFSRIDRYRHPVLANKIFFTENYSLNLMEGEATLKLREIGDD